MVFVWTLNDVLFVIVIGFFVLIFLACIGIALVESFVEWVKKLIPHKGKTHEEESENKK